MWVDFVGARLVCWVVVTYSLCRTDWWKLAFNFTVNFVRFWFLFASNKSKVAPVSLTGYVVTHFHQMRGQLGEWNLFFVENIWFACCIWNRRVRRRFASCKFFFFNFFNFNKNMLVSNSRKYKLFTYELNKLKSMMSSMYVSFVWS